MLQTNSNLKRPSKYFYLTLTLPIELRFRRRLFILKLFGDSVKFVFIVSKMVYHLILILRKYFINLRNIERINKDLRAFRVFTSKIFHLIE